MNLDLSYYVKDSNFFINTSRNNDGNFKHSHSFIELTYVTSGHGIHSIGDVSYMISAGDILMIMPSHVHSIAPLDGDSLAWINCVFEPDFTDFDYSAFKGDLRLLGSDNLRYRSIFNTLLDEYMLREPGFETVIRGYTMVLLASLLREQNSGLPAQTGYKNLRAAKLVKTASAIINSGSAAVLNEKDVAEYLSVTPGYLSRVFKKELGCTLREYILMRRLDAACSLLTTTNLSIDEVVCRSGFSSRKAFYVNFRRITSMTPGEYRARGICF